jgi:hypothetical protein
MKQNLDRRQFIRTTSTVAVGLGLNKFLKTEKTPFQNIGRVGIIGLDTSHSVAFTK